MKKNYSADRKPIKVKLTVVNKCIEKSYPKQTIFLSHLNIIIHRVILEKRINNN